MSTLLNTRITELLGCKYPVIQTAMGWVADPKLVAATGNAGGFGFLAGATIPPEQMEANILEVKSLTDANFGVNFGADSGSDSGAEFSASSQLRPRFRC